MIEVTRLNGSIFFINPDLILSMEATPDTIVTLTTGEKLVVKDSPEQIIDRFVAFKRRIVIELPQVTPYEAERFTR
jgi:flagellar protein FlbD